MSARGANQHVTGVVLAGGASQRMGGPRPKALAPLGDATLLDHVLRRLAPQCGEVWLSVSDPAPFEDHALACVPDGAPRRRGPLEGLRAALERLAASEPTRWLLLAPCDAPFLPLDLAARLVAAAERVAVNVAVACAGGAPQPTFSLWRGALLPHVERLLAGPGRPGLRHAFEGLEVATVDWPDAEPPPFFNVNTPRDLARAARWLDAAGAEEG